jgi:uncharacterized protein (DUF2249 family)/quercetin dioxygenase-like cupin family protein
MAEPNPPDQELDVRGLPKPEKHPTTFATFDALPVGGAMVLVNDHDPTHLHDEFATDLPGSFSWTYLRREPRDWRIRIDKLTATPLPRVLVNTRELAASPPDVTGAAWKLEVLRRDLDANLIALPPNATIDAHLGPELDVLIHVVAGDGQLVTETESIQLEAGAVVWLPRRSQRQFTAGPEGLRYLTVHQRRQALVLNAPGARGAT